MSLIGGYNQLNDNPSLSKNSSVFHCKTPITWRLHLNMTVIPIHCMFTKCFFCFTYTLYVYQVFSVIPIHCMFTTFNSVILIHWNSYYIFILLYLNSVCLLHFNSVIPIHCMFTIFYFCNTYTLYFYHILIRNTYSLYVLPHFNSYKSVIVDYIAHSDPKTTGMLIMTYNIV